MAPPRAGVTIWWDTSLQMYRVITPFKREFVDLIHQMIPASDRYYDKPGNSWVVTERMMSVMQQLTEKCFACKATIQSRAAAEASAKSAGTQQAGHSMSAIDAALVEFLRLMPYEAIRKGYLTAAMLLHPDRGGDAEKMSRFNSLWQKIEKELYSK